MNNTENLNQLLKSLKQSLENRDAQEVQFSAIIKRYEKIIDSVEQQNIKYEKDFSKIKAENTRLLTEIDGLRYSINLYPNSLSWKFTKPIRQISWGLRKLKKLAKLIIDNPSLISKGVASIRKYGITHSLRKIKSMLDEQRYAVNSTASFDLLNQEKIYILTTKHCFFIANLIKENLAKLNLYADIVYEKPHSGYGEGVHFVICPQMFDDLPDAYIAYQLEQSVSSRWFTEDYIRKLENSYAIFDYSLNNIDFLQKKGLYYQKMYFMPIGYNSAYEKLHSEEIEEEYDVLFYGDINNERRQKFLSALKEKFKVKIVAEVFGKALYNELRKAKVIVNIHYYEGALLETTRLFECLSLGKMIVSETSSDIDEHQALEKSVDFVPVNDIQKMCERVEYWLNNETKRRDKIKQNIQNLNIDPNWFEFYFMRFMLASDWISFDKFYQLVGKNIHFPTDFVCLGLPESTERAKDFAKDNLYNIHTFPGLRHKKGWIGCGLSYKFMLKKAKEQKLNQLVICEDDVEFKPNFSEDLANIRSYLETQKDWDIFSGVIADLNKNARITKLDKTKTGEYIYIDKMTSMVFNIYSARFFDKIVGWNESNQNVEENAIDRYIENSSNVTTITRLPYLVGHKEDLNSTLWGFQNDVYSEMIKKSVKELSEKVKSFKEQTLS